MHRTATLYVLSAVAAGTVFAAGCSQPTPACKSDADCYTHETCELANEICVVVPSSNGDASIDAPLELAWTALPDAIAGTPYMHPLTVAGGTPPYTWSVNVPGELAWLSIVPDSGLLMGTPPAPSDSLSFEVHVIDAAGQTGTGTLSVAVTGCMRSGCEDAGDAGDDAGVDAGENAGPDAGTEADVDGGTDAGTDAGSSCTPGAMCRPALGTCDVEEYCSATGTCPEDRFEPNTKQCGSASCSGATYTPPRYCEGTSANCETASPVSCNAGYVCSGSSCRTSCSLDAECASTHFCNAQSECAAKRSDGQPCTAGNQCTSGACQLSYADLDGDGFGVGSATSYCGTTAPVGRAFTAGDCCDADTRAYPGQTSFFTTARACNGGGYDFDCDGSVTERNTAISTCENSGTCFAGDQKCGPPGQTGQPGWIGSVPPCGGSGDFVAQCIEVDEKQCLCSTCTSCLAFGLQPAGGLSATQACR